MAAELPLEEIRLGALVSRRSQLPLSPPLSAPETLPFGELSPPVFERLVGEVMWLIDGMNDIRGYGRSGQDQGGLDLIGRWKGKTHVYQVRRIVSLPAPALRAAVTDFTGPPRTTTPAEGWSERRFDAVRFVLATGCVVDDTAVEDELVALQEKYQGDIDIDLYDARALSRFLRERPYLVAGVFGPEWAKAFCGVETPSVSTLPHGYALLNDPLEHLGLADALHRAQQLAETEPGPAAELFGDLAHELEHASFTGHANQLRTRQRDLLASAGQADAAFSVAATLMLDRYETGDRMFVDQRLERLASDAGGTASNIYEVLKALADWFEYGYDLAPVTTALVAVVQAGDPMAARLVLAVIEQIVVDEHPDDHPAGLAGLASEIVTSQGGLLRIRLECCLADLSVRAGQSPEEAYADLDRRALGGRIPERFAVLVHMRRGRALALADLGGEAIEVYRRAVLAATREGLGGDARHALRSISFLSDQYNVGFRESSQAMLSARTVGAKGARLIDLSFNPAVSALEALVDDRLPDASRASHQWLWQDRISGALTDENLAHQRYGEVFDRAGETKHAVRHFILAGRRKDARSAAESLLEYLDVCDLLEVRARWVCTAAAAVTGQQADLIPDDVVASIAARLTEIVTTGARPGSTGIHPVREALGALAALDERLPEVSAQQVLPLLVEWIPREPNNSRIFDEQMLAFLGACVKAGLSVADQAGQCLLDAWKLDVRGAEGLLAGLHAHLPSAVSVVRERAQQGHTGATALLADWQVDDPSVAKTARQLADTVLAEPVGTVRPFYAMGTTTRQCAAYLTACSDDQSSMDTGDPITLLRERVTAHLLLWAEDRNDIADRRSEAVRALSILAETLPAPVREDTFERLMDLYQAPAEHPANAFDRSTQHPLSRYKINDGGDWRLPAEILHASAALATTAEQALRVEQRLLPHLSHPEQKPGHGWLQAQTMLTLDRLAPAPASLTATHPSPFMRQTAVLCWGRADHRDPSLARLFAEDSSANVRHSLARALADIPPDERLEYEAITERLRTDNSARVRRATAQIP
ncbi:HEAT repeat domain-containing protein [Streptomyces sp. TRM70350]|uniref:HEAT repeat domain-containing protein n=1 Tax=Streptomyces sp. TRM70350 TaxID=2856165 RepID=UPI001C4381C9|nr:HEAT repeat domain-containing protein [Streptomyces sp. TRM70350]MBV7700970.1 HEAT repeat domain-containing protein [Streptomyces sp. TRM70350]